MAATNYQLRDHFVCDTSVIQPVLLQNEGRDGGKQRPHEAVESPPVILQDEPGENDEATQRVVDEHHLGGTAQNPVQQLQQKELPWKTEAHLIPQKALRFYATEL